MNDIVEKALRDAEDALFRARTYYKGEFEFAQQMDEALSKIREALLNYGGLNADDFPRLRVLMVLG
jgi:hypothetical protein